MTIIKAASASGPFFDVISSDQISTAGLRSPATSSRANIIFQSVTFAYPTRPQTQVLRDFNACFEKGKTTAIVGPSGSGKSTLVALVERWYELQDSTGSSDEQEQMTKGRILVDNHNINELDVKWWRSQIGLVQQEPVLFNESVYTNVAFGLIGSPWEHEAESVKMDLVTKACQKAFADIFIKLLPLVIPQSSWAFFNNLYLTDENVRVTIPS